LSFYVSFHFFFCSRAHTFAHCASCIICGAARMSAGSETRRVRIVQQEVSGYSVLMILLPPSSSSSHPCASFSRAPARLLHAPTNTTHVDPADCSARHTSGTATDRRAETDRQNGFCVNHPPELRARWTGFSVRSLSPARLDNTIRCDLNVCV